MTPPEAEEYPRFTWKRFRQITSRLEACAQDGNWIGFTEHADRLKKMGEAAKQGKIR